MNDNELNPLHRQVLEWMLAGKTVQGYYESAERWQDVGYISIFYYLHHDSLRFRLKPETIKIGDIEVPKPESEAPKEDADYYMPDMGYESLVFIANWANDDLDHKRLKTGCLHLTKEAAIQHAKALIIASGGTINENE